MEIIHRPSGMEQGKVEIGVREEASSLTCALLALHCIRAPTPDSPSHTEYHIPETHCVAQDGIDFLVLLLSSPKGTHHTRFMQHWESKPGL